MSVMPVANITDKYYHYQTKNLRTKKERTSVRQCRGGWVRWRIGGEGAGAAELNLQHCAVLEITTVQTHPPTSNGGRVWATHALSLGDG
jgi:hypothetical protein